MATASMSHMNMNTTMMNKHNNSNNNNTTTDTDAQVETVTSQNKENDDDCDDEDGSNTNSDSDSDSIRYAYGHTLDTEKAGTSAAATPSPLPLPTITPPIVPILCIKCLAYLNMYATLDLPIVDVDDADTNVDNSNNNNNNIGSGTWTCALCHHVNHLTPDQQSQLQSQSRQNAAAADVIMSHPVVEYQERSSDMNIKQQDDSSSCSSMIFVVDRNLLQEEFLSIRDTLRDVLLLQGQGVDNNNLRDNDNLHVGLIVFDETVSIYQLGLQGIASCDVFPYITLDEEDLDYMLSGNKENNNTTRSQETTSTTIPKHTLNMDTLLSTYPNKTCAMRFSSSSSSENLSDSKHNDRLYMGTAAPYRSLWQCLEAAAGRRQTLTTTASTSSTSQSNSHSNLDSAAVGSTSTMSFSRREQLKQRREQRQSQPQSQYQPQGSGAWQPPYQAVPAAEETHNTANSTSSAGAHNKEHTQHQPRRRRRREKPLSQQKRCTGSALEYAIHLLNQRKRGNQRGNQRGNKHGNTTNYRTGRIMLFTNGCPNTGMGSVVATTSPSSSNADGGGGGIDHHVVDERMLALATQYFHDLGQYLWQNCGSGNGGGGGAVGVDVFCSSTTSLPMGIEAYEALVEISAGYVVLHSSLATPQFRSNLTHSLQRMYMSSTASNAPASASSNSSGSGNSSSVKDTTTTGTTMMKGCVMDIRMSRYVCMYGMVLYCTALDCKYDVLLCCTVSI
jgi:hypothetical protein